MTNDGHRLEPEFVFDDEFDHLFANTSPNPNREGCPSKETLAALSSRKLPIGDPGYLHIVRCSPCFREFRAMQQERKKQRRLRRNQALGVAALIVLAIGGPWMLLRDRSAGAGSSTLRTSNVSAPAADQQARLDLRPFVVTRGDQSRAEPEPLVLPRARVNATLLLPVGADEGPYELRLLDRDLSPRATAEGSAAIVDFVTTLRATLDLRAFEPGAYQLGIRRAGGEWQMFPARIQ